MISTEQCWGLQLITDFLQFWRSENSRSSVSSQQGALDVSSHYRRQTEKGTENGTWNQISYLFATGLTTLERRDLMSKTNMDARKIKCATWGLWGTLKSQNGIHLPLNVQKLSLDQACTTSQPLRSESFTFFGRWVELEPLCGTRLWGKEASRLKASKKQAQTGISIYLF